MRLALFCQRYAPQGGPERFLESALEAVLERNVAITLYTREWPQTNLQLIEPYICDPSYVGALWRDWGFARAVGRAIGTAVIYNGVDSEELLEASVAHRMAARGVPLATRPPATSAEAPPLHGEDGLQSETLAPGDASVPGASKQSPAGPAAP